jgi:phosphatidylglycerol lysyltransferase
VTAVVPLPRFPSPGRCPAEPLAPPAERVRRWGDSSVSPFTLGAGRRIVELPTGGLIGFVPHRRCAVMAADPVAPPGRRSETLDAALTALAARRLRPVFTAVSEARPYLERGLWTAPVADDPVVDLRAFGLAGGRMASIRHSVTSARRSGLTVVPWSPALARGAAAVSAGWLATKRGGEMGFTLGRFDPAALDRLDTRVALDAGGHVIGLVTWHAYRDGAARVLDLMRRAPGAPNPTMDLLIAESLIGFAAAGVTAASLGSVPRSHGTLAERAYPTISLRRYKDKFAPRWEARHLAVPSRTALPAALAAVAQAYCPEGLRTGWRPNR